MNIADLIFYAFLVSTLVQFYFYFKYFWSLAFYKENKAGSSTEGVSIIIAAKNEAKNLRTFLPKILEQEYGKFEVIVVNNFSTDNTWEVLNSFENERLSIYDFEEKKGKKAALQFGIVQAQYEKFLFTDADCMPNSKRWLSAMSETFSDNKEIILGHARFYKTT